MRSRILVVLLLSIFSTGCAVNQGDLIVNYTPGETLGETQFVAVVGVVRTRGNDGAVRLQVERQGADEFSAFYAATPLQLGGNSLEVFAFELEAGTYRLHSMFDPSCYDCGYYIRYSFPFAEYFGAFSGKPGEVVMLGTVFVEEAGTKVLTTRAPEASVAGQKRLLADVFPQLDLAGARVGWAHAPDESSEGSSIMGMLAYVRERAWGMHSPLLLDDGSLAVGSNAGTLRVFDKARRETLLDTGMMSGPVLAIAEPEPGVLIATSGAEMRRLDPDSGEWSNVKHNLPSGMIEDLIRLDNGYAAIVKTLDRMYVATGDFGGDWRVLASTEAKGIGEEGDTMPVEPGLLTQVVQARDAHRVGDKLYLHAGAKLGWSVDLNTGETVTFKFPSYVRSFNVDDKGVHSIRGDGPLLSFDHWRAHQYIFDRGTAEWTKLAPKVGKTAWISDTVIAESGAAFCVVENSEVLNEITIRRVEVVTDVYAGDCNIEGREAVFSAKGTLRYAGRFQNNPGIYVTDHYGRIAYSLDDGESWTLINTF
jgi:hypothetical protein